MSRNNLVQVFEYGILTVDDKIFTESHFGSLVKFSEKNQNQIFKIGYKKIIFQNYVGVLQVGNLTIEVLPKADRSNIYDKQKWRSALYEMLRATRKVSLSRNANAQLNTRIGTLFDFYIEEFLFECESLISEGLQKKYSKKVENLNYFKGRVLFSKQFSLNATNQARVLCEYDNYDLDHTFHRIIKHALELVSSVTSNPLLVSKSKVLCSLFPDLKIPCSNELASWRMKINRNTNNYIKSLNFAELIIKAICPTPQLGKFETIAFLFEMNKLFEHYVLHCLKKVDLKYKIKVQGQLQKKFWESKVIRPDILVNDGVENFIIDTKWKVLDTLTPSDNDLKQMFVYGNYFNSLITVLIYPNVHGLDLKVGRYHASDSRVETTCSLVFLDLFNEYGQIYLPEDIGAQIVDKLHRIKLKAA